MVLFGNLPLKPLFISASQIFSFFKKHFLASFIKHSIFSKIPILYCTF